MLTASIILLLLATLLTAASLRARTTARGTFCRRCRFDLAGLDHARTPTCPECGRDLRSPNSTRSTLRAANPLMLAVAALLMLLSIAGLTANAPSVQAFVLPRVSDSALVWLDRAGLNGARAEVLSRLANIQTDRPALASLLDAPLDRVIALGTHASIPDRDLIRTALQGAHFTPEQAQRFFERAFDIRLAVRQSIPPDAESIPATVLLLPRVEFYETEYRFFLGRDPLYHFTLRWSSTPPSSDPADGPESVPAWEIMHGQPRVAIPISDEHRAAFRSGGTLPVQLKAHVEVTNDRTGQVVARLERSIQVSVHPADNPESLISIVGDPGTLHTFARQISIRCIEYTKTEGHGRQANSITLNAHASIDQPTEAILAHRATLVGPGGDRIEIDGQFPHYPIRARVSGTTFPLFFTHWISDGSLNEAERMARWIDAGKVDVILTPDRSVAQRNAWIDSLLQGSIIVRDVPLIASGQALPGEGPQGEVLDESAMD